MVWEGRQWIWKKENPATTPICGNTEHNLRFAPSKIKIMPPISEVGRKRKEVLFQIFTWQEVSDYNAFRGLYREEMKLS